jgi:hypothetical protein
MIKILKICSNKILVPVINAIIFLQNLCELPVKLPKNLQPSREEHPALQNLNFGILGSGAGYMLEILSCLICMLHTYTVALLVLRNSPERRT